MPDATPESWKKGKAPFLCAPYTAAKNGRYEPPQSIDRCPLAKGGERCQVVKHGFRNRKTGPEIGLRILHCKVHHRYFTVYPVGHVPYDRCPLAAVDLCGEPIQRSQPAEPAEGLFEAASDAAKGRSWACEPERPRYPTQRRRIERSAQLLGLVPSLCRPTVEGILDHLDVAGLDHHLACRQYQGTKSLKARGSAILDIRQRIGSDRSRVLRLLAAGSLSGLWGHPWLWDAARGRRLSLLSRLSRALRSPP